MASGHRFPNEGGHQDVPQPNIHIKEEPQDGHTAALSDALDEVMADVKVDNGVGPATPQLLPYPSYSFNNLQTESDQPSLDIFDMISKTARDIATNLQTSIPTTHTPSNTATRPSPTVHLPSLNSTQNSTTQSEHKPYNQTNPSEMDQKTDKSTKKKEKKEAFHIDQSQLSSVPVWEQGAELQSLGLTVYNQDDLEQGIMAQVDQALAKEEQERMLKIIQKDVKNVKDDLNRVKEEMISICKLEKALLHSSFQSKEADAKLQSVQNNKEMKIKQLKKLKARLQFLTKKLTAPASDPQCQVLQTPHEQNEEKDEEEVAIEEALGLGPKTAETETERMIRQGEMTPFGTVMTFKNRPTTHQNNAMSFKKKPKNALINASKPKPPTGPRLTSNGQMTDFEVYLTDQQQKKIVKKRQNPKFNKSPSSSIPKKTEPKEFIRGEAEKTKSKARSLAKKNHKDNSTPVKAKQTNMFDDKDKRVYRPAEKDFSNYRSSRPRFAKLNHNFSGDGQLSDNDDKEDSYVNNGDADFVPHPDMILNDDDDYLSGEKEPHEFKPRQVKKKQRKKQANFSDDEKMYEQITPKKKSRMEVSDDENGEGLPTGKSRDDGDYDSYRRRIKAWRSKRLRKKQAVAASGEADSDDSDLEDVEVDAGFRIPARVWNKLYKYQKTCVKWLWELHVQQAGGIVGDEMGLGKTIQLISFLVGLKVSKSRDRGANTKYLGLGPTLIVCPATVMHQWVKEFHKWWPPFRVAVLHGSGSSHVSPAQLVDDIVGSHGVLVTSFSSLTINQDVLLDHDWQYVALDEGHKIRNPDAKVTIAAKQFRTCHRLILSGSPIQNNLKELWSLFDFIFPGKLGTLPDFMEHFAVPIQQGGYCTASQVQVQTAYKCSCVLRDTINPYLLRRMKSDVKHTLSLPDKNEQVLFCRLTDHQRDIYKEYLDSRECQQIIKGEFMVFPGLITMRKICNHPDLTTGGPQEFDTGRDFGEDERIFGHYKRSGKMIVIESLLKLWKKQGHRVLLFSQSKQMLDLLESFVNTEGYTYVRMDGGTSISARQPMITRFNQASSYFCFLLTTRVGGLGVNLTGANRVVIFDPDWNPSTDMQARERAWRIGQTKDVTVYRLITAGTIEEKIYHRQIFKQFLTNRVLKDPKQRRLFKANDMYELFTLTDIDPKGTTETSAIFAGTGSDVKITRDKESNKDQLHLLKLGKKASDESASKKQNRFDMIREMKEKLEKEKAKKEKANAKKVVHISDDVECEGETSPDEIKRKHGVKTKSKRKSSKMDDYETVTSFQLNTEPEESIDLNGDDSNQGNEDDAEVSTEDARTQRLRELARKLSQRFSIGNAYNAITKVTGEGKKDKTEPGKVGNGKTLVKLESSNDLQTVSMNVDDVSWCSRKKRRKDKDRECKDSKKKRRRKDAVFEGERINHLAKAEVYKTTEEEEKKANMNEDEYVLAKLFKKSGVHSAMQHDKIMMSSDPDFALVEGEADRVARDAAKALKRSRTMCNSARSGIPTWTGQSGQPAKPRFGLKKNSKLLPVASLSKPNGTIKPGTDSKEVKAPPAKLSHFDGTLAGNVKTASGKSASLMTSNELLSKMKTRNQFGGGSSEASEDAAGTSSLATVDDTSMDLITDIRNYVAFMAHVDGQASTQEIVDYFRDRIPTGESAKFKAMLKQICDFDKQDGFGLWRLKPELR